MIEDFNISKRSEYTIAVEEWTEPMTLGLKTLRDLVVVSDLHLGEGIQSREPRYVPNEDFFYDEQFQRFLEELKRKYRERPDALCLVFNGDTFDFLTVTSVPDDREAARRRFSVSSFEKKFGLNPTAKKSLYKLDRIVSGHRRLFKALACFAADGFHIDLIRGNHDLELFFPEVKHRLLTLLTELDPRLDPETARRRISFHDWFYLEPGRVYIEHGNQYDAGNSIRYPFHPILQPRQLSRESDRILDYPLGSIFVRFFYNRVRLLDPYSPRIVSFDHYLAFIKRYNLFDVWKVYKDHYPHFIAAVGTAPEIGSAGATEDENLREQSDFKNRATDDILPEMYAALSALKISPMAASKMAVVRAMISAVMRRGFRFALLVFGAFFLWFGVIQLIGKVPGVTMNAFLLALFAVASLGGVITIWIHLDRKLRRKGRISDPSKMPDCAEHIAQITGAKMVLFGHTHMVDYRRIEGADGTECLYANSGTWTSVDNPWVRFMQDARRLTFLYVTGNDLSLLRWNDDAVRFDEVPLFESHDSRVMDRLPSVSALDMTASGDLSLPPEAPYFKETGDVSENDDPCGEKW